MVRSVGSEFKPWVSLGKLFCSPVPQFPHLSSGMFAIYLVKAQKALAFIIKHQFLLLLDSSLRKGTEYNPFSRMRLGPEDPFPWNAEVQG